MDTQNGLRDRMSAFQAGRKPVEMTLEEYLQLCRTDPSAYATAAERMLKAIGEPEIVDTSKDARLGRIFMNRTIRQYPAFAGFHGMEEAIERIVGFFRHAAQGLEESKQVLYLLGPVGGGKSSLAERIKALMEHEPIYVLKAGNEISPVFESPLGLFDRDEVGDNLEVEYGIPQRLLGAPMSPWAIKRLEEFNGDAWKFSVVRVNPSRRTQVGISKVEPGDENNQDISCLVGKVDLRKLEAFAQNDPDSYAFSGGLNRSNQGMLEFVEMFKAPIKMLHPLLTATQERNYVGTENIGMIPFTGIVTAHCFSDDTELMTRTGWRRHSDIQVGDMLATMNRHTGELEYQPALRKWEQHYAGPMYHFRSHAADHLVTPNHKMLVRTAYSPEWRLVEAAQLKLTGNIWPVSAPNSLPDHPVPDDELRLMVWTVTDGSIVNPDVDKSHPNAMDGYRVRFHLRKERKKERLSALLARMGIPMSESHYADGTASLSFVASAPSKRIPDYYADLSARQCRLVLEEYSHTDGSRTDYEGDVTQFQLSSNVAENADRLQHIAVASGSKATLSVHIKDRYTPQNFLSVRPGVTHTRGDSISSVVDYAGTVFCYETANHTLVARRNGKVLITGNSNEAEWASFKNNKQNEAFIDRVFTVKVPYCLRVAEEQMIYSKIIDGSQLASAPCAPGTLEMMARFAVLSRLREHENSNLYSKMRVYDGEALKETDPRAKSMQEYRDAAGQDEGMSGISTRFAYKVLASVFNFSQSEIAADPVHLLHVLETAVKREQLPQETEKRYLNFLKQELSVRYAEFIGKEIQKAYLESYGDYGQNLFERYINYADAWIEDHDFKDPDTGNMMGRASLNAELEKIEKPAGIANPKDFRNEIVKFALRSKANNGGNMPGWSSYEKIREVIEKRMFSQVEELLPVISFGAKRDGETERKHNDFVERMVSRGYTPLQVRRLVEWYMRVKQAG